ncbi:class I SAM-dependent methyltransferase [Patescibacteria group bacterium]|nr:class I SAM-dependent methyltransferase [Patescibacteria group bacterium]MCL5114563.1 class I SAM-dependent methyltransferase [Patescibacteria group bacterium]
MEGNKKISPTAWMVAEGRTFSDIPFSREIFREVQKIGRKGVGPDPDDVEKITAADLAPRFEARYKIINHLVRGFGFRQVLEIASGLTPRGIEMTEEGSVDTYVEMDLPGIIKIKRMIVKIIYRELKKKKRRLFLEEGDALDNKAVFKAAGYFDAARPIAVVSEGLLRYLNFKEKAEVARNIHHLLAVFGGAWITPDVTVRSNRRYPYEARRNEYIERLTGIDMEKNKFESVGAAQRFFEELGFRVEQRMLGEIADSLVSPGILGLPVSDIKKRLEKSPAFVLSLSGK